MNVSLAGETCNCNNKGSSKCCCNYLMLHFVRPLFVAIAIVVDAVEWALFARFTAKMKLKSTRAFLMRIYMF